MGLVCGDFPAICETPMPVLFKIAAIRNPKIIAPEGCKDADPGADLNLKL
jgi:hypothetical protein